MNDINDLAWFRSHPDRNYRVRPPKAGEVEELARRALPPGGRLDGEFKPPADSVVWRVLVLKVDRKTTVRFLTLRDKGDESEPAADSIALYALAIGHRVAVDSQRI